MPAPPAAPVSIPLPIWYFTKSFRLPTAAMLDRLSIACSTSGGTDTFSTTKLVISRPYFPPTTGLMSGNSASPSSVNLVATSRAGTCDEASASLNTLTIRDRIVSANSSSRKCWSEPATSFRKSFGSMTLKSNVPNARMRTTPKSWSRTMIGLEVPHLLPVNSRVAM